MIAGKGLLERERELAVLAELVANVERDGRGALVLVSGEAGVGKTALLRQFCDHHAEGAQIFRGACDPLFTPEGASSQSAGAFSVYLETLVSTKSSGVLQDSDDPPDPSAREFSYDRDLTLYASWTPLDRVTLTLDVPFAWNRIIHSHDDGHERTSLSGVGDVSLATSVVLWRDRPVLPSRWLEGRVWLKAPTGPNEDKVDGERDPHLQPGTGSWDAGVGLAGVQRFEWGSLYGSVFRRWNTEGALDYRYGNVWLATLALEAPLGHLLAEPALDFVTPGLGLDFRYAGRDESDGESYASSGGAILFATPALRIRLPFGVREQPASLRLAVQLPLTQDWLHTYQREKPVWSVGVLVPF
jgi:hypothetical protein